MDYKEIKKRDREFGKEKPQFDIRAYAILVASVTVFILAIAAAVYFFQKAENVPPQPTETVTETTEPEVTEIPREEQKDLPEIGG